MMNLLKQDLEVLINIFATDFRVQKSLCKRKIFLIQKEKSFWLKIII